MELGNNIRIVDLGLYLKREKALVIADVHMGYEEALNKAGMLIPRSQYRETVARLKKILADVDINLIVINGDLKHEFGVISETEWRHALGILDIMLGYGEVVLVKGNHDMILGPIAGKRNISIVRECKIGEILICHGHERPKDVDYARTIIMGHMHPCISLHSGGRAESYKCFLIGRHKGKDIIVQPSFNLIVEGTDVLRENLSSPLLPRDLSSFRVIVVNEKILDFGLLENIEEQKGF